MKQTGQGLVEYSLIGAFVLLACLIPLKLMSSEINYKFTDMLSNQNASGSGGSGSGSGGLDLDSRVGGSAGRQNVKIKLADGSTVSISVPGDPALLTETTGANGATFTYSQSLKDLAKQLKEEGKIEEETFNDIMKLSNLGHEFAQIEGMIEGRARSSNGSRVDFISGNVISNGQNYTLYELSKTIGIEGEGTENPENGEKLANFLQLQKQVLDRLKNEPDLKEVISHHANNISTIAKSVQNTVFGILMRDLEVSDYRDSVASTVSHEESANVCHAGGFSDSGENCS